MKVSNLLTARLPIVVVLTIVMGLGLGMISLPTAMLTPSISSASNNKPAHAFNLQTRPISDTSAASTSALNTEDGTDTTSSQSVAPSPSLAANPASKPSTTASVPPAPATPAQTPSITRPCGTCPITKTGMAIACPQYCIAPVQPCGMCGGPVTGPYQTEHACPMYCME